jgi:hypothetical protein
VLYVELLQALRKEPLDEGEQEEDLEEVDEAAENNEILGWLETLERIDPMRRGRYRDQGMCVDSCWKLGRLTACRQGNSGNAVE